MKRPIYFCQGSCGEERKKKNFYNGIDYRLVSLNGAQFYYKSNELR